jgi:hypothetical protein
MIALAVVVLTPCVIGFVAKFYEMCVTLRTDPEGVFVLVPMVNYISAGAGFGFLLAWAIGHGMFRDIEAPKFEFLERERLLDQEEFAQPTSEPDEDRPDDLRWDDDDFAPHPDENSPVTPAAAAY